MKITIQTKQGPRTIPDWAKCYCVTRHTPNYIHPYPFALPNGEELWLCPNTYHQATTLKSLYEKLNAPPTGVEHAKFNYFVRALMRMYWQQVLENRQDEDSYSEWVSSQKQDEDDGFELAEYIKRLVVTND